MKKLIFSLVLFYSFGAYGQEIDLQEGLSKYYKEGKRLYSAKEYRLSMAYLDSSFMKYGSDTIELIYSIVQYAKCLDRLSKYDSALINYNRAISLARVFDSSQIPLWHSLLERGVHFHMTEKLTLSNRDLKECITLNNPNYKMSDFKMGWAYRTLAYNYLRKSRLDTVHILIDKMKMHAAVADKFNLSKQTYMIDGYYLYEIGDIEGALEQFRGKFDFMGTDPNEVDLWNNYDVQNLAAMHQETGDFERAEEYFLAVDAFHRNEGHMGMRSFYHNLQGLTNLYLTMEDFEKALEYSTEFLTVYEKARKQYIDPYYHEIITEKARALAGLKKWKEAQNHFEKAVKYFETIPDNDVYLAVAKMQYGLMLQEKGDYERSLELAFEVLNTYRKLDDLRSQYAMISFKNIANVYEASRQYTEAQIYRDSAIWVNDQNDFLDGKPIGSIRYPQLLTDVLIEKLQLYKKMWEEDTQQKYLTGAIQTLDKTNEVINYTRKIIRSDNNRLATARNFYDLAVFFNVKKYELSQSQVDLINALTYVENNKSFLLNELRGEQSKLDDDQLQLLLKEKKKMKQILMAYSAQNNAKEKIAYFERLDSIQKLLDASNEYDHFRLISIDELASLDKKQSILSTHLTDEKMYCFFISGSEVTLKTVAVDSLIHQEILAHRNTLLSSSEEVKTLSFADDILQFIRPNLGASLKIIPDGMLNYVPFELFPIEEGSDSLLMDLVNISYLNSINDLLNGGQSLSKASNILSMAPNFESEAIVTSRDVVRGELAKLPGAYDEVNIIKEFFSGTTFLKEQATEHNFVKEAGDYGIIHLATHAIVDDANPLKSRLVFNNSNDTINDGYLHAYEIYNLDLNAQLVTLSACNTGFGQIKKGEGVMSLSRSFAYAGVPAAVVSLWPASDKSTPELMKYFYQNLKEGQRKSVALNNARKQYLATAKGKARHPFYWGGFVVIGNDEPIEEDTDPLMALLTIAFLVAIFPLVLVIKKKYLSV